MEELLQYLANAFDKLKTSLMDALEQVEWEGLLPKTEDISALVEAVLPLASWILRFLMIFLGILVLSRNIRSLFQERTPRELWGTLCMTDGTEFPIHHWESAIGRSRSCDIILELPFISRNHATLLRDDKGNWTLFPLENKNGVFVNGAEIFVSTPLVYGDILDFGGLELAFYPLTDQEEREQNANRGIKHRRISPNLTLVYLTLFQLTMMLQSVLSVESAEMLSVALAFATLSAVMWFLYALYRSFKRTAFELESLAFFLSTLCFGVTSAHRPSSLLTQTVALLAGIVIFFSLSLILRDLKRAISLRWPLAIFAGALLSFNLLLGAKIFGAKNWIVIGNFSFQPSELIKIIFIMVTATSLERLFARRNLVFTTLFAGFCVGCLGLMSDFGTALIFFVAFLVVAFLRSGNLGFLVMTGTGAVLGAGLILHFKPYIANRFEAWRHVWAFADSTGFQQTRTLSALASGGLFGKDPSDVFLKNIGAANTDLVFGVVGEEFGLLLALGAVVCIFILPLFAFRCTATARSSFYSIASCTAAAMLTVQTMLNVFGAVDILPLTGVTFPFLSVGGSSMISCWGLLAFLKAADTRHNASFSVKYPTFGRWFSPPIEEEAPDPKEDTNPLPPVQHREDSPYQEPEGSYHGETGDWNPKENEAFWDNLHREREDKS